MTSRGVVGPDHTPTECIRKGISEDTGKALEGRRTSQLVKADRSLLFSPKVKRGYLQAKSPKIAGVLEDDAAAVEFYQCPDRVAPQAYFCLGAYPRFVRHSCPPSAGATVPSARSRGQERRSPGRAAGLRFGVTE